MFRSPAVINRGFLLLTLLAVTLLGGGCGPKGPATTDEFFRAVVSGNMPQVKAALRHHPQWISATDPDDYSRTALHKASEHGHRDVAVLLLSEGADLNARDQLGYTPLMYAIHGRKADLAVWLIDRGARIDWNENNGFTALHNAAFAGLPDVVKALIRHGAELDAKAGRETPLHLAAQEGHVQVARILLENGADPRGKSDGIWTPLSAVSTKNREEIVTLLKEYGGEQ
jgi:ankyrin repeat protein